MKHRTLTVESGFISQIQKYGLQKLVLSWDFVFALLVFALLICDRKLEWHIFSSFDRDGINFIVTVSSAVFSVLITALAIILSFSSSNFVKFLRENNLFDRIIFIFWWTSIVFLTVIFLTFTKSLLTLNFPEWAQGIGSAIILSMFLYALIQTYFVVGALMRFAFFLGHFESPTPRNKK